MFDTLECGLKRQLNETKLSIAQEEGNLHNKICNFPIDNITDFCKITKIPNKNQFEITKLELRKQELIEQENQLELAIVF